MNDNDRPSEQPGASTAGKGTPMAVELSSSRRAKSIIVLFLAAPLIWSLHFLVVYLAVEAGCTGNGPGLEVFDPPVPVAVTLVATAVAALACAATAVWGYRRWRRDQARPTDGAGLEPPDRAGSLAFAGFLLSLLGVVAILFVGVPALFLPACAPVP